jgi:hypothetical protein
VADINECQSNNGNCDLLTSCDNSPPGSFRCGPCPKGYTGNGTAGCSGARFAIFACTDFVRCASDIDECLVGNGGCDALSKCTNRPGDRVCGGCPDGYTGTGETGCRDVDECGLDNGNCDRLTQCFNTPGSHYCGACPEGYSGDGKLGCTGEAC